MTPASRAHTSQGSLRRLTLLIVLTTLMPWPVVAQVIGDLQVLGDIQAGSTTHSATVNVFRSGIAGPVLELESNDDGGILTIRDEAGILIGFFEPDAHGEGTFLEVLSTGNFMDGSFLVDGNYAGSTDPMVGIIGTSTTIFDMSTTGDASVVLPTDAINATEILNETGVTQSVEDEDNVLTGGVRWILSSQARS